MDKEKEKIILYHKRKRRKHKIKLGILSTVFLVIALTLIGIYIAFNKKTVINYKENSDVNYKVNLIENEFYKDSYLDEGIDVIANIIKSIDVEFKYNLDLGREREYTYNYKILAETEVKEKSKTNSIYETEQEILNKPVQEGRSNKLEIVEKINVDYNEYNNQINKLIEAYKLVNTTSNLHLNLYLNVIDKATGEQINKENKVMSLEVPLTTRTVEITVNENVKNSQEAIIIQNAKYEHLEYCLIAGAIALIAGLITLASLIKYILDTRSAEKMYDDELRKILFDYKSYIQKINSKMDYKDYKIIKIDTFKELIEMKEEVQSPIFMYTDEERRKSTFIMLNGNLLFECVLGADLIREKLIKRSKDKEKKKNEKNK